MVPLAISVSRRVMVSEVPAWLMSPTRSLRAWKGSSRPATTRSDGRCGARPEQEDAQGASSQACEEARASDLFAEGIPAAASGKSWSWSSCASNVCRRSSAGVAGQAFF